MVKNTDTGLFYWWELNNDINNFWGIPGEKCETVDTICVDFSNV